MTDLILDSAYLIILMPLWIFLIIMCGRFFSVYVNKIIIYILTLLSSGLGVLFSGISLYLLKSGEILEKEFQFLQVNDFTINCGLHIDKLGLIFAFVLFVISFCVQLYSISYMQTEKKNYRFFALMNLFNFSMLGLFFSPNLFQIYFFWEIVSVISYLLIGFEYFKAEKSLSSKKVLLINRIGDTGLITAIIISSYFMFTYSSNLNFATLSFVDMNAISTFIYAYTSSPLFVFICSMFILAAVVKSAQVPFYTWLQDAMEAKLPVSALLHSATMVALGIFLLIRLNPYFVLCPIILKLISFIGLLTAFVCGISACAQNHPKKALAYSTSSQLGLIFYGLGFLNIKAGVVFFVAHAFIKSMMFLTLPKDNEEWNYTNFIAFLLSGFSLSGLMLSGLVAKELLMESMSVVIGSLLAFITAFYTIRIAFVTAEQHRLVKQKPKLIEFLSILILFGSNIIFYIYLRKYFNYNISAPFYSALTACILTYVLYIKKMFWKVPIVYGIAKNGFYLDKFYTEIVSKMYFNVAQCADFIDKNVFGNYRIILSTSRFLVKVFDFVETNIMNNTIKFLTNISRFISLIFNKIQTGNVQRYNAYAFIIITFILTSLVLLYTRIMTNMRG